MSVILAQAASSGGGIGGGIIALIVVAVIAIWAIGVFNGLTRLRNAYKNAFAQIDVQL